MTTNNNSTAAILENIASNGIAPPSTIYLDGKIHRFGKKKLYWYVAHQYPVPVCIYGDWKLGTKGKYVHHDTHSVSSDDRLREQKTIKELEKRRLEDKEQQLYVVKTFGTDDLLI